MERAVLIIIAGLALLKIAENYRYPPYPTYAQSSDLLSPADLAKKLFMLESIGAKYFTKPTNFEQRKKISYKSDISKMENMDYDPEKDEYTCANGRRLVRIGSSKQKSKTGYESEATIYECESCENCPFKEKCTKAKGNRRLKVSKVFQSKRAASFENITSEQGVRLRVNRWIQSEGAFGVLKQDSGFTRFLTRGSPNVKTETLLLCLGYNINKLHAKIQGGRCGKDLHEVKVA